MKRNYNKGTFYTKKVECVKKLIKAYFHKNKCEWNLATVMQNHSVHIHDKTFNTIGHARRYILCSYIALFLERFFFLKKQKRKEFLSRTHMIPNNWYD